MEILGATLRVCVDDIETAIPFYERLAGGTALRFERAGVQVAAVGCFLLIKSAGQGTVFRPAAESRSMSRSAGVSILPRERAVPHPRLKAGVSTKGLR